ncbi:MAG: class I SAM-dependent methyltransferase [Xanthomonadales bacterium]|nr:class I SAM-dependent methyltransferase [Xanthomonadales bacterium]
MLLALGIGLTWGGAAHAQAAPAAAAAQATDSAAFDHALAGDWRSSANRARDVYRHPKATLEFFDVRPDQTVIEITPGGGWYSEVLAPYLRDRGHYIAAVASAPKDREAQRDESSLKRKFLSDPTQYANAAIREFDPQKPVLGQPGTADRVLTFRNVHNWMGAGTAPAMFKAFFDVLRPGGVLGVVDHRAAKGATLDAVKGSGYLPTDYVVKLATDAGFELAAESEINANPKDTKDYAKGVWTLPPTYTLGATDRAKYAAIGESDRMTLRFVKPASAKAAPR